MQRKLYTEFDLLFDFIIVTVFGQGNKFPIFHFIFFFWGGGGGYEFSSGVFRLYFLSI